MRAAPPRLARFQTALRNASLDGALLFGADAICYFTGYWRYLGGSGAVVVPSDDLPSLVLARDEENLVDADAPVAAVGGYGAMGWGVELDPEQAFAAALRPYVARGRWGVAFHSLAPAVSARLEGLADVEAVALAVRQIKDDDERERIAAATRLTLLGQQVVQQYLQDEQPSEIGALSRAHAAMQEAAGEVVEVVSDMIAGDHAGGAYSPIAPPGRRAIAPGETVISDLLLRYQGYWGQSTRIVSRGHIVDPEVQHAAGAVRAALETAATALRPGITAGALDALMQAELAARIPGSRCPHHTGHGIGLSFGDAPQIVPREPTVLREGMVLTLSPGAYRTHHHGVRTADVYAVTAGGAMRIVT